MDEDKLLVVASKLGNMRTHWVILERYWLQSKLVRRPLNMKVSKK